MSVDPYYRIFTSEARAKVLKDGRTLYYTKLWAGNEENRGIVCYKVKFLINDKQFDLYTC